MSIVSTIRIKLDHSNPQGEVFGRLKDLEDETPIPYMAYQISKYGIGIIAQAGLDALRDLALESPRGTIALRILSIETNGVPENGARYNLMAVGLNIDLEQIYASEPSVKEMVGSALLQFARFQTMPPAMLTAQTFGSTNPYQFKTINASKSGIYVVSMNRAKAPFHESTLIEFEFNENDSWLLRKVKGMGRIVHQATHEGKGGLRLQYYGIELKEFRTDGEAIWRQALENLERQTIDRQLKEVDRTPA